MTTPDATPLRADAQRNRERILTAAKELLADRGISVGFDEIARAAGVGTGTVYRRFPCRDALIDALFEEKLDEIVAIADAALAEHDVRAGIASFCERMAMAMHSDRALPAVMMREGESNPRLLDRREEMGRQMGSRINALVQRGHDAGVLRDGFSGGDLMVLTHLLGRLHGPAGSDVWRRYLILVLDSIWERGGNTPLPGPGPDFSQFEQIVDDF
ncbi:TetR/AcrR family transcriptional regulator [Kribbia dieselivorans]|uniref:TetR/AcrR family transcriptional regulator n=1 Tax=Kribbia dieselivorans TaxID=331526 RepID=UPI000837EA40|nr:TetR/AcrR family transcriptional regulator [Kribbia dieselivorans]